jgi:hypothetical protein
MHRSSLLFEMFKMLSIYKPVKNQNYVNHLYSSLWFYYIFGVLLVIDALNKATWKFAICNFFVICIVLYQSLRLVGSMCRLKTLFQLEKSFKVQDGFPFRRQNMLI